MVKCRICDDILEEIESINDGLVYVEPCPSCVKDAVEAAQQSVQADGAMSSCTNEDGHDFGVSGDFCVICKSPRR